MLKRCFLTKPERSKNSNMIAKILNNYIKVSKYKLKLKDLPTGFDGFKIVQVSDLHNETFGKGNKKLIKKIKGAKPDIIIITGDLIDSHKTKLKKAYKFCEKATKIADTYFVSGNHEGRLKKYKQIRLDLEDLGVKVLDNETAVVEKKGEFIQISGLRDPRYNKRLQPNLKATVKNDLAKLFDADSGFNILLAHSPLYIKTYLKERPNLIFCGHEHGGNFLIPFLGKPLWGHNGWLPKYVGGVYKKDGTYIVISRGLGKKRKNIAKIGNPPELVAVKLKVK